MKRKIELEIERYNKFRFGVLGMDKKEKNQQKDVDIRNYAKYILKEGSVYEKRELLECLKSKLVLKDKVLRLEE